jgi:hypothetical protein
LRVNGVEVLRRPGTEKVFDLPCRWPTWRSSTIRATDDHLWCICGSSRSPTASWSTGDCWCRGTALAGDAWPTPGSAEIEVHELYQRTLTDPDAFELEGDQLDLQPMVRELVLLDTPSTPLCRPDCAGLCPTCGVNHNDTACDCAPPPADPRWAGLAGLTDLLPPE